MQATAVTMPDPYLLGHQGIPCNIYLLEKKSIYKWILTAPTCVIQGSIVLRKKVV